MRKIGFLLVAAFLPLIMVIVAALGNGGAQAEESLPLALIERNLAVQTVEMVQQAEDAHTVKILFTNGGLAVCEDGVGTLYPMYWLGWSDPVPASAFECNQAYLFAENNQRKIFWVVADGRMQTCTGESVNPGDLSNCQPATYEDGLVELLWTGSGAVCRVGGQEYTDPLTGQTSTIYNGLTILFDDVPYVDTACDPRGFLPSGYALSEMRLLLIDGQESVCDETIVPAFPELTNCRPGEFRMSPELYD